jgi:hypothetical protein
MVIQDVLTGFVMPEGYLRFSRTEGVKVPVYPRTKSTGGWVGSIQESDAVRVVSHVAHIFQISTFSTIDQPY